MTVIAWTPNSEFEQRLGQAFLDDDHTECLALLRGTELALPTSQAAHHDREPHRWATYQIDGRRWIAAFTSIESMVAASGGVLQYARIGTLDEIAAGWPDQTWGLAVNPGLEVQLTLESGAVARTAAPSLEDFRRADPRFDPVLQKVLTHDDLARLLDNDLGTVSGYVQPAWDTAHIAAPTSLLSALALEPEEHLHPAGSLFLLRWRPLGLSLYIPAYGGHTTDQRDAVAGAIVELEPFVGLGFGRNRDQVIHEHKAMRAPLPTGAELWELTVDGEYTRRAILDRGQARWRLVGRPADVPISGQPAPARTARGLRSGGRLSRGSDRFIARYGGTDYVAAPFLDGPDVTLELRESSAEVVDEVPLDVCDALHYERPVCTWHEAPCVIVQERDEHVFVEYVGNDALEARRLGLRRDEQGVYRGLIPTDQVRSVRNEIVPLKVPDGR